MNYVVRHIEKNKNELRVCVNGPEIDGTIDNGKVIPFKPWILVILAADKFIQVGNGGFSALGFAAEITQAAVDEVKKLRGE